MTTTTETTILDQVVILNLDVHIWSGRKKLRESDLKLPDGTVLPPSTLASLGSKKICDPNEIKVFDKYKRQALRLIDEVGIRFPGGHLIPLPKAKKLVADIEKIRRKFLNHKVDFIKRYNQITTNWIDVNPEWGEIIQKAYTPVDVVRNRIDFKQSIFHIAPVEGVKNQLDDQVLSMSDQLYKEISAEAQKLIDRSISTRSDDSATQRVIKPIMRMKKKMTGLSFLDSGIFNVIDELDRVVKLLPKAGKITGKEFAQLLTFLITMSDKDKIKMLADGLATQAPDSTFIQPVMTQDISVDTVDAKEIDSSKESVTDTSSSLPSVENNEPEEVTLETIEAETTSQVTTDAEIQIELKAEAEMELAVEANQALGNDFVDNPKVFESVEDDNQEIAMEQQESDDIDADIERHNEETKAMEKQKQESVPVKIKDKLITKPRPPKAMPPQPSNRGRPGGASAPQPTAIPCF